MSQVSIGFLVEGRCLNSTIYRLAAIRLSGEHAIDHPVGERTVLIKLRFFIPANHDTLPVRRILAIGSNPQLYITIVVRRPLRNLQIIFKRVSAPLEKE